MSLIITSSSVQSDTLLDGLQCLIPTLGNRRLGNLRARMSQLVPDFEFRWNEFSDSWSRLASDEYMGDGGGYRFRRYAVFEAKGTAKAQYVKDQNHYQSVQYNAVNGGVYREYPCIEAKVTENPIFQSLLECSLAVARDARPNETQWRLESHQFRIVASSDEAGKPVPEGIHRDGVDFVFIFLVDRKNIRGGVSRVYRPDGHLLEQHKMSSPLDFMAIDDHAVLHNVTPIYPRKLGQDGYRDVLVITARANSAVH